MVGSWRHPPAFHPPPHIITHKFGLHTSKSQSTINLNLRLTSLVLRLFPDLLVSNSHRVPSLKVPLGGLNSILLLKTSSHLLSTSLQPINSTVSWIWKTLTGILKTFVPPRESMISSMMRHCGSTSRSRTTQLNPSTHVLATTFPEGLVRQPRLASSTVSDAELNTPVSLQTWILSKSLLRTRPSLLLNGSGPLTVTSIRLRSLRVSPMDGTCPSLPNPTRRMPAGTSRERHCSGIR